MLHKKIRVLNAIATVLVLLLFTFFLPETWAEEEPAREVLRMMLIPLESPSEMYRKFLPVKRYLQDRLNRGISLKVARNSSDILTLFKKDKIDVAFVCPTLYCEIAAETGIEPLVKLQINGSDEYRSVLVVRDDADIRKISDLYDTTMVYGRYRCPGSGLLPDIMLGRIGMERDDFFDIVRLGSDESAMLAVMARMFDVTGVPEMSVRQYLGRGLRILRYSYPIPQYLFVARKGLGDGLIADLRKALLDVNVLPGKEAVLGRIEEGISGFTEAKDSDYDIVRLLMRSSGEAIRSRNGSNGTILLVEPVIYAPDMFRKTKRLKNCLEKSLERKIDILIPQNNQAFVAMKQKIKNLVILQENSLYRTKRAPGERFVSRYDLLRYEKGLVITLKSSKINSLTDLKNRSVGVISFDSEGGYLSQARLLDREGIRLKKEQFSLFGTYENVVMAVYRKEVDAGFVSSASFEEIQKDIDLGKIKIMVSTPPLEDWVFSVKGLSSVQWGIIKDQVNRCHEVTGKLQ
jgi:phosphonate transport system substrate-binding protein